MKLDDRAAEDAQPNVVTSEEEDDEWGHFVFIDEQPRPPILVTRAARLPIN
jgi:hypothetical protein